MSNRLKLSYNDSLSCIACKLGIPSGSVVTWSTKPGAKGYFHATCANIPQADIEAYLASRAQPVSDSPEPIDLTVPHSPEVISTVSKPLSVPAPVSTSAEKPISLVPDHALGVLATALTPYLEQRLASTVNEDRVLELIEQAINSAAYTRIDVLRDGRSLGKLEGSIHCSVPVTIQLLTLGLNVYLYGPPGAGKTHAAAQVAKALGVPLVPVQMSKLSPESSIKGFVGPDGTKHEQLFVDAIQGPCVLFCDEFDRWPAHLVTLLNGLLANNYLVARGYPQPIERHKDCYILAAGNTTMRGRDEYFPEAQAQDFSTLDRFAYVSFAYDETLETKVAESINPACGPWLTWIRSIRPEAMSGKHGKILATPRSSYDGAKILRYTDLKPSDVADMIVFKGIDRATRDKLIAQFPLPSGACKPAMTKAS